MQLVSSKAIVCSVLLGTLLVLAFAPFEYHWFALFSLATFFFLLRNVNPIGAFWLGLAYGYGVYGVGVSWVYVSLSTYGGMPLWMGFIAVAGFAGILALFIALTAYVVAWLAPSQPLLRLAVLPFVFTIFEWMKSWVLTGFPWLDIGYSQTPTWLFAWAPVGGVYLVSLLVLILASALVALLAFRVKSSVVLFLLVLLASWQLNSVEWSTPIGQPIQVGIVQGNVPIDQKWQAEYRNDVIAKLGALSRQIQQQHPADLIVWPETALPLYLQQTDSTFWKSITQTQTALLTGIMDSPSLVTGRSLEESYNAAVLVCDGRPQLYRKRHLVPFGEYLPLRFLFNWVLEYLALPMTDFSSWQGQQALVCGSNINVGLSICYEDAFANEYRQHVGDATLLVNISEDAWFGDSFAPHQRIQMAQMRARELARPLVRSANSGPSMFIDERGEVLAKTPQFEVSTLSRKIQPQTGDTWYKRFGNWVILLCFAAVVLSLRWRRKTVS